MKIALTLLAVLGLTACSAGDEAYCRRQNTAAATASHAQCLDNYRRQASLFERDRAACRAAAEREVPDYLYKTPGYEQTEIVDPRGIMHTQNLLVEPGADNRPLDKAREAIVRPCLEQKGWRKTGSGWADADNPDMIFP